MPSRSETVRAIEENGIVGIIRMKDPEGLPQVAQALAEGGVQVLEITMTVPGAVELIRQVSGSLPKGFFLGAGTVIDAATVDAVVDAGARFIVSPVLRMDVIEAAHRRDVPVLPGCFTPTEIFTAWQAGADIVKLFPSTSGPSFIRDMRGPLPQIKLMPTGGVSVDNAGDWIRAGAVAVGVGSALLDPAAIASRNYPVLTGLARQIVNNVTSARRTL
jgi:2-dehydro-3-deoxyphosphogluconate aldolase/(4S)-4-hydroxy-2-oxoglutarate aldolase